MCRCCTAAHPTRIRPSPHASDEEDDVEGRPELQGAYADGSSLFSDSTAGFGVGGEADSLFPTDLVGDIGLDASLLAAADSAATVGPTVSTGVAAPATTSASTAATTTTASVDAAVDASSTSHAPAASAAGHAAAASHATAAPEVTASATASATATASASASAGATVVPAAAGHPQRRYPARTVNPLFVDWDIDHDRFELKQILGKGATAFVWVCVAFPRRWQDVRRGGCGARKWGRCDVACLPAANRGVFVVSSVITVCGCGGWLRGRVVWCRC